MRRCSESESESRCFGPRFRRAALLAWCSPSRERQAPPSSPPSAECLGGVRALTIRLTVEEASCRSESLRHSQADPHRRPPRRSRCSPCGRPDLRIVPFALDQPPACGSAPTCLPAASVVRAFARLVQSFCLRGRSPASPQNRNATNANWWRESKLGSPIDA
jgi:hypothetical protein